MKRLLQPSVGYRLRELPVDWQDWDQKGWSHLGSLMVLGVRQDPGNFLYACLLVLVCASIYNIPEHWTRLKEFISVEAVKLRKFIDTGLKNYLNSAGDVVEAVAGAVNMSMPEGRSLCKRLNISQAAAQEVLSILSNLA